MLAVSSWCWHEAYYAGHFSLLDVPGAAAEVGLAAVELNDFMLPPPRRSRVRRPILRLVLAPEELWRYTAANLERVRAALEAAGVSCLTWTLNSDLTVEGLRWRWQQYYVQWGLRAARLLGAPLLRVTLGGRPDSPTTGDKRIAGRLAYIVRHSQVVYPGVVVVLENHWGISMEIGQHLAIFEQAKGQLAAELRPYFGLCFDPGNIPGPDPERYWPALAQAARHVHFKTGRAALNYPTLFDLLRQANYQGHFTLEYEGDGNVKEGVLESVALFRSVMRDT
jgi:sugar phosphate isomerase/epimerase